MDTHHLVPLKKISGLTIVLLSLLLFACKDKKKLVGIDPGFSKYIEAYTSGVISKKNTFDKLLDNIVQVIKTMGLIWEKLSDADVAKHKGGYYEEK